VFSIGFESNSYANIAISSQSDLLLIGSESSPETPLSGSYFVTDSFSMGEPLSDASTYISGILRGVSMEMAKQFQA
jgi:hypothetical protein